MELFRPLTSSGYHKHVCTVCTYTMLFPNSRGCSGSAGFLVPNVPRQPALGKFIANVRAVLLQMAVGSQHVHRRHVGSFLIGHISIRITI